MTDRVTPGLREAVRERFGRRCAYCGLDEDAAGSRLTIDHFRPRSEGGTDDSDNLVYACHTCNLVKASYWDDNPERRLLHPLDDDLSLHFVERTDCVLVPLTELGRVYIRVLQLNREELVARRRRLHAEEVREADLRDLLRRFASVEAIIRGIQDRFEN